MGAATKAADKRVLSAANRSAIEVFIKWEAAAKTFKLTAGIAERWTDESPEWTSVLKSLSTRRYRQSLENLSHLVVQRLVELEKLGIGDTGLYIDF